MLRYARFISAAIELLFFYSCGGVNTPTLCVVTKGIKADCNYLKRTTGIVQMLVTTEVNMEIHSRGSPLS